MAHRIEEDSKGGSGLVVSFGRTQGQRVGFARVEVRDAEVEVQLLRYRPFGPSGRDVGRDLLEPQRRVTLVNEFDPVHVLGREVAEWLDLETGETRVERGERERVGAVEGGDGEVHGGHRSKLPKARHEGD